MELFDNHKFLFRTALALFVGLTILVAVMPAIYNQENNAPLPNHEPLTEQAIKGKRLYISNGCVACHTQQVRNLDMDKMWGERPSIPADYATNKRLDFWTNTATLMGTERTGPDLTNIGNRQPSQAWNLLHLYQPRAVVAESVMPAYPWLFKAKTEVDSTDVVVNVPPEFRMHKRGTIVATEEALQLVAYLQSLKQTPLPTGTEPMEFLYANKDKNTGAAGASGAAEGSSEAEDAGVDMAVEGEILYRKNCASCHQTTGEGLQGAFPPLKGSSIVNGDDVELITNIIMLGYDARPEYAIMTPIGTAANLTPEEVTAIINHVKSSWGNSAEKVTTEEVGAIMETIEQ